MKSVTLVVGAELARGLGESLRDQWCELRKRTERHECLDDASARVAAERSTVELLHELARRTARLRAFAPAVESHDRARAIDFDSGSEQSVTRTRRSATRDGLEHGERVGRVLGACREQRA
jgi:hypothetical protein